MAEGGSCWLARYTVGQTLRAGGRLFISLNASVRLLQTLDFLEGLNLISQKMMAHGACTPGSGENENSMVDTVDHLGGGG